MNREKLKTAFANYTKKYNSEDPKIALKIKHTYRVAELCETIGKSLGLESERLDVVWACGMLHDIGRFEQIKRYNTFVDAISMDHALLSTEVLFGENMDGSGQIREFVDDDRFDQEIMMAVRWHSAYRIPEDLDEWTRLCCHVVRDADKLDIFRINLDTPYEEIYNVTTEELYSCEISENVLKACGEHHTVLRSLKATPIDYVVGNVCLAFELVYEKSRELALSQGYLQILMSFESWNAKTREQMNYVRNEVLNFLRSDIKE